MAIVRDVSVQLMCATCNLLSKQLNKILKKISIEEAVHDADKSIK